MCLRAPRRAVRIRELRTILPNMKSMVKWQYPHRGGHCLRSNGGRTLQSPPGLRLRMGPLGQPVQTLSAFERWRRRARRAASRIVSSARSSHAVSRGYGLSRPRPVFTTEATAEHPTLVPVQWPAAAVSERQDLEGLCLQLGYIAELLAEAMIKIAWAKRAFANSASVSPK